ncbi:MAG: sulfate adenylyltransferase [Chloroflexota bacterium]|nr:MAG: sulfate adenylyltransferase [Chloroflexota bacterium]
MSTQTAEATQYGSVPHGGQLVNARLEGREAEEALRESHGLPQVALSTRTLSDVEMIAIGAYSPLDGFMGEADYRRVVDSMHLANGVPWSIPVTLPVQESQTRVLQGARVALAYNGTPLAMMDVRETFLRDTRHEAQHVYRTTDEAHPGVAALYGESEWVAAGPVRMFAPVPDAPFPGFRLTPAQTRQRFAKREWRTVVGFQTRNPVHRAHEYLQKCALEIVDGLLLHPLVGETKSDDVPAAIRMRSYESLLEHYYPQNRVLLAVNPAAMRYAGPREAIFHALIRKNFGCTHFIVGRDHAGVGSYYGPYDAQHIFLDFPAGELGIQPLFFENSFFCRECGNMATQKTCPHPSEAHVTLSGTQVRQMLRDGQLPPPEFSRPEVAKILADALHQG